MHHLGQEPLSFWRGWCFKDSFPCAVFEHFAVSEKENLVRHGAGKTHLVGRENDLLSCFAKLFDDFEDLGRHLWIQGGGGLV